MTTKLFGTILFTATYAALAGAAPQSSDPSSPEYQKAVELVRQLRDDRFTIREAASKKLLAMGRDAKAALLKGKDDTDPEVSERCRRLLPEIITQDLKIRVDAFIADKDGKKEHELPAWEQYQKSVGKDATAREFFGEMLQSNMVLFGQYELEPEQFASRFQVRANELIQTAIGGLGRRGGGPIRAVNTGEIGTIFFFGSMPEYSKLNMQQVYFSNLLYQGAFQNAVKEPVKGLPLRKLFFSWLEFHDDQNTLSIALSLVQQFSMKEGVTLALRIVKDKVQVQYIRAQALTVVGKMGGKEHAKDLEAVLGDDTQIQQFNLNGKLGTVQIRDVALGMMIHLNGKSPKDFGFEFLTNDANMWSYYYLGFETDEKRAAAHKKWKESLEEPKKK